MNLLLTLSLGQSRSMKFDPSAMVLEMVLSSKGNQQGERRVQHA
jgi:hypothetical protein